MTDFFSPQMSNLVQLAVVMVILVILIVLVFTWPTGKLPSDIGGQLFDIDRGIKGAYKKIEKVESDVQELQTSGTPKGFYPNIDLTVEPKEWSDEELDNIIRTTDQIAENEARSMIIHKRDWKVLQSFREVAYSEKQKRMEERSPIKPKQKETLPAQQKQELPPGENPFPFLK